MGAMRFRVFLPWLVAAVLTVAAIAQNADSAPAAAAPGPAPAQATTPAISAVPASKPGTTASNGQQTSTQDDDSVTTIRKTVNEVNVVFTVTDKHGRYVKDLNKSDFKVIDDSKPAEEVKDFRNQTDLPLQVGLLVDASNSVRDRFKFEQESAIEFLNQTIRPKYDAAFIVGFDVTPEGQQPVDPVDDEDRVARAPAPAEGREQGDSIGR